MGKVSQEGLIPQDSPDFFRQFQRIALEQGARFRFDVSLAHGNKDIMPLAQAWETIQKGINAGEMVLVQAGFPQVLYAFLQDNNILYGMSISRTFPENDQTFVIVDPAINIIGSNQKRDHDEIVISGRPLGGSRRDPEVKIRISSGIGATFGVLCAPFPQH